jgi:hypothetical protein
VARVRSASSRIAASGVLARSPGSWRRLMSPSS